MLPCLIDTSIPSLIFVCDAFRDLQATLPPGAAPGPALAATCGDDVLRPVLAAAETRSWKLVAMGLSILQKMAAHEALLPSRHVGMGEESEGRGGGGGRLPSPLHPPKRELGRLFDPALYVTSLMCWGCTQ